MLEKIKIGEYKGYRYIVTKISLNKSYCCGYIVIDTELMEKLGIDYDRNEIISDDGTVTYVYNSNMDKEWCLRFDIDLKENESIFGFDRNHIYSDEAYQGNVENTEILCKDWIDWIIQNSVNKE